MLSLINSNQHVSITLNDLRNHNETLMDKLDNICKQFWISALGKYTITSCDLGITFAIGSWYPHITVFHYQPGWYNKHHVNIMTLYVSILLEYIYIQGSIKVVQSSCNSCIVWHSLIHNYCRSINVWLVGNRWFTDIFVLTFNSQCSYCSAVCSAVWVSYSLLLIS